MSNAKKTLKLTRAEPPAPSGFNTNQVILELRETFENQMYPTGLAAAIICNDLKQAVNSGFPFMDWATLCEAVRYVHTHVPTAQVLRWRGKIGKGGGS